MKLTTKGAAARLLVAPATLANWRSQGRGPRYLRIGGKILYDNADLDAYEVSCRQTSTAQNRRAG
jgi:hypothetical protein